MSQAEQKPVVEGADVPVQVIQQRGERAHRGKKRRDSDALDGNLHFATLRSDTALMHSAIAKGANVNSNLHDRTVLQVAIGCAIREGKWEPVQMLLDAGAVIGFEDALWLGNTDLVRRYLKEGYEADSILIRGMTPLHIVAHRGFLELVDLLLELGAMPDPQDSSGKTPLLYAYMNRHLEVVSRLREAGAKVGIVEASLLGETLLVLSFLDAGVAIETYNEADMTPLMATCMGGHLELARLLLDRGADLNAQSVRFGITPALCATRHNHVALLELLVERGLEVHAPIYRKGRTDTLLQTAATEPKSLDTLRYLISQGGDVDEKNLSQDSLATRPLHLACLVGNLEATRLLLDAGADIEARGIHGTTPLDYSLFSLNGDLNLVKLLIERGADVNAPDRAGMTPLRIAILRRNVALIKLLIRAGADVHEVHERGENLLSTATLYGNEEIMLLLMAHGLRMSLRTRISRMLTKVISRL